MKISISNIIKLLRFEIKTNRKPLIIFPLVMTALSSLYLFLFPTMKEMGQAKINSMPKELLNMFGIGSFQEITQFQSYFAMIFHILSLVVSIYILIFANNLVKKEEKNKTIEFLNSLSISRSEIYISKYLCVFFLFLLTLSGMLFITIISGITVGDSSFNCIDIFSIYKITGFSMCLYITVSFALASAFKNNFPYGLSYFACTYLYGYLITLLGKEDIYMAPSPYHIFSPGYAVDLNDTVFISLIVYLIIYISILLIGNRLYTKRDFQI